jgi:amino acid permease
MSPHTSPSSQHAKRATAMMIGTMIGVGIFGVPFVIAKSGVLIGLLHFVVLGGVILFTHVSFGELSLRTTAHHRLVGYAELYLGPWGKRVATLSGVFGAYGSLLAYIMVSGSFLHQLFGGMIGGTPWHYSLAFAAIAAFVVFRGLRLVQEFEFLLTAFLFLVMALIVIVGIQHIDPVNFATNDWSLALLPFGAVLFSLGGVSAVAEIRDMLRGRERLLLRSLVKGTIAATVTVAVFTFIVIGISGMGTSSEAIAGLEPVLGRSIVLLGAVLGFVALATSFVTLSLYLNEVFRLDFHFSRWTAFVLGVGAPVGIFLMGQLSFTQVIVVTGAIFGGLDGILIALCVLRARTQGDRNPEFTLRLPHFVHRLIIGIYVLGILATVAALCTGATWCTIG